ncbi:MAG: hypothetical protein IJT69_01050 [Clostridia bacterium]|nr:hypothetical protein [Clostridia bacterium]
MFGDPIELTLHEYFVFEAVLGEYCERESIFPLLGKIFRLSDEEIATFLAKISAPAITSVHGLAEYYRSKRILQFLEITDGEGELNEEENYLISLKGNAFTQMNKIGMIAEESAAAYAIYGHLIEKASAGVLVALRILGILRCTGIGVKKDLESGRKELERAAHWGDVVSAIALCEYGDGARDKYAGVVLACLKNTPFEYLREEIFPDVAPNVAPDENVRLLKKGMEASRVNRVIFDPVVARVVFSEVIDGEAKEALIFSSDRTQVSEACEFPLSLSYAAPLAPDPAVFSARTFGRAEEVEHMMRNVANVDLRATSFYAPLCFVSDSRATRESYYAAIKEAFSGANVAKVRPPFLPESFDPNKNHIFLRNLVEKKANVLVFFFEDQMERPVLDILENFLNGEERRRFRVKRLALSLDLGAVLPICISDKSHQRELARITDQIVIAPLEAGEKDAVIAKVYERYCERFSIEKGSIAADALAELAKMDFDDIDATLKKLLLDHRSELSGKEITTELAKPYLEGRDKSSFHFGFGGNRS